MLIDAKHAASHARLLQAALSYKVDAGQATKREQEMARVAGAVAEAIEEELEAVRAEEEAARVASA